MKKIITIFLIFILVLSVSACETTDKMVNLVKSNIEDIADGFTDGEGDKKESVPVENSISVGISEFDTFNPIITKSDTVREAMQFVFEPLFELDESMHIVPVLASGYSISADGLTYNITMKQDVLWHDGKTFDAYDVAYTIKYILSLDTPYTKNLKDVADYSAVNNDTLRIVLKRPVAQFAALLSFPIVKYQTDMTLNPSYTPVGTGAFEFKGKIGIDKYLLSSFDMYHNGKSKIDNVYIQAAPGIEQYRAMFDVSETDVATSESMDLTTYMPKGNSKINDFVSNKLTFVGFNFYNSVVSGANTRAGIAELIDKTRIVDTIIYSRGTAVDVPINPTSWLYYDTNTNFNGNREKALELFGNDGWGFNIEGYMERTFNGKKELLKLTILTDSQNKTKVEIANSIKEDLEKCGIIVSIDAQPYDKYVNKIETHNFDVFIGEYDLGLNQDILPLISSSGNYFSYVNPESETLISQAGMTQDEENLKEIYRQLGETLKKDMPFIPLYYAKNSVLSSSKIIDGITPSVSSVYRMSNIWSVLK
jgi:peptide/nickel transport system substrate-binding protein